MNKLVDERGWHGFCRIYSCEVLWQKLNCYTNIMSVTNMMRILICCISLLSFMACNETSTKRIFTSKLMDNDAVKNSPFVNTRPVPGLITSPRILGQKGAQKCVLKDTFSVMNNALCK